MQWSDLAKQLPRGLELLGRVIGGPIGILAQGAGAMMADALGVEANPDSVEAAIKADPGAAARLVELQMQTRVELQKMANQQALAVAQQETRNRELELADVQSARLRDMAFIQSGQRNARADIMVGLAVLGLIMCLGTLVFFRAQLPGEAVGIISTVAGIFGACLRDAFQFEFGSSRSSQQKDKTIASLSGGA